MNETTVSIIGDRNNTDILPELLTCIGHVFFSRLLNDTEDVLFMVTNHDYDCYGNETEGHMIVALFPQEYSGGTYTRDDLDPQYYRPVSHLAYKVTEE
jgi:hypothetical protein